MLNTQRFVTITNSLLSIATKNNTMETLQYKIIKTDSQYENYCDTLEALVDGGKKTRAIQDEIELLTLLIEKYDEEHNSFDDANSIELLKALMKENKMKNIDLAKLLDVSEGLVSEMLNYKKGLSKTTIRILSERFKLRQEAFSRPYKLRVPLRKKVKNPRMINSSKNMKTA